MACKTLAGLCLNRDPRIVTRTEEFRVERRGQGDLVSIVAESLTVIGAPPLSLHLAADPPAWQS